MENKRIGSPPRVRGTAIYHILAGQPYWITPACAGNSAVFFKLLLHIQDHPRVCGEQI